MSQTRSVAHNSLVLFAGKVAALFIGALTFKLLTMGLGEGGVADYGAVLGFLSILVSCADCGLTTITARELARDEEEGRSTFGEALALRLVLGPLLIPLAIAAAFLWYRKPDDAALRLGVAAAACVVPLQLASLSLTSVFQVRQKMIYLVLGDFVARLVQLGAIVGLLRAGQLGYYSALGVALLGMGIYLLVSLFFARRLLRFHLRFDLDRWRELIRIALPLGVGGILSSIYFRFDFLYLRSWHSGEAGLYYAATRVYDYSLFVPTSFITVAFPILVGQLASGRRSLDGLQRSFEFLLLAGIPLAAAAAVLAPQVIRFLYTAAFAAAVTPLRLLMAAALFSYLTSLFAYTLIAINRQGDAMRVMALVLAVNVGLNLYVIPRFGMVGAASCMLATECLSCLCTASLVRRHCGFAPGWSRVPRILAAAGVMAVVLAWLADQGWRLWALTPIGLAVYGSLAYLLHAFDHATLREILRLRGGSGLGARGSEPDSGKVPAASGRQTGRPEPPGGEGSEP